MSDPETGVAADYASEADEFAEVQLYWTPTMNGNYCVDAEHYVYVTDEDLLYAQSSDCVSVTVPKVDIIWNGNAITNTTQEAIVGQKIDLSIAVTGGGTPSNHQWSVGGEKVKNYVVNFNNGAATSAVKTDLTGQDLNQSSVQFYWIDGGDGIQVSYTAAINGTPYTASATFNVKEPTVDVTTSTRSSYIYTSGFGQRQELLFGDVALGNLLPGITFTKNNYEAPAGFSGDTVWIQTVVSTYTRTLADGQTTQTASGTGLDTVFPYSQLDPNAQTTNDSPGVCLRVCNNQVSISKMQVQLNADMWLMFKPKNLPNGEESIYVPLQKVTWNWAATATRGADFLFTLTDSSNSQNPVGVNTTSFPEWSNIVTGEEPYQ